MKPIEANKDHVFWTQDHKGFFTIRPFYGDNKVFVRFYTNDMDLKHLFSGKKTVELVHKIVSMDLISRPEHAAYLGKEIEKALIALQLKIAYIQDEPLDFGQRVLDVDLLSEKYDPAVHKPFRKKKS